MPEDKKTGRRKEASGAMPTERQRPEKGQLGKGGREQAVAKVPPADDASQASGTSTQAESMGGGSESTPSRKREVDAISALTAAKVATSPAALAAMANAADAAKLYQVNLERLAASMKPLNQAALEAIAASMKPVNQAALDAMAAYVKPLSRSMLDSIVAAGGGGIGKSALAAMSYRPSRYGSTMASSSIRPMSPEQERLEQDLRALEEKYRAVIEEREQAEEYRREMEEKERLGFVFDHVAVEAHGAITKSVEMQQAFTGEESQFGFVVAIDIRRSTELMLKAKTPQLFARFITGLCEQLAGIVLGYQGVVDKFTGDGILAFFPPFFSGADAGYRAVLAASACHALFAQHYVDSRNCFTVVPIEVGLGVGIDCGDIHLVKVSGGLTVVGKPVVYACRMSSAAPAGITLVNQPAYEELSERHSGALQWEESQFFEKHEGLHLAYTVQLSGVEIELAPPGWEAHAPKEKNDGESGGSSRG